MAREDGSCWHCGAEWANEAAPATTPRAIPSRRPELGAVAEIAHAATRSDADRWTNEGGSIDAEPAVALRAVAASG